MDQSVVELKNQLAASERRKGIKLHRNRKKFVLGMAIKKKGYKGGEKERSPNYYKSHHSNCSMVKIQEWRSYDLMAKI